MKDHQGSKADTQVYLRDVYELRRGKKSLAFEKVKEAVDNLAFSLYYGYNRPVPNYLTDVICCCCLIGGECVCHCYAM